MSCPSCPRDLSQRAVSPVMGVILLVAVTVILSATVGVFVLNQQPADAGDTNSAVTIEETATGVEITAVAVDSPLEVQYGGEVVETIQPDETGATVSLPMAPGEDVTVIAQADGSETVVTSETYSAGDNPSLLAYYTLDGTSGDDYSGNERHAEPVRVDPGVSGVRDSAFHFTRDTDTQSELLLPEDDLFEEMRTFCFSVNFDDIYSTGPDIDDTNFFHNNGYNNPDDEYGWYIHSDDTVTLGYGNEGRTEGVLEYSGIPENEWTHMCHTVGEEEMRLYVNGTVADTVPTHDGALNFQQINAQPLFGRHVPDNTGREGLAGQLDEVRLYSEPLSAEEVQELYESTHASEE